MAAATRAALAEDDAAVPPIAWCILLRPAPIASVEITCAAVGALVSAAVLLAAQPAAAAARRHEHRRAGPPRTRSFRATRCPHARIRGMYAYVAPEARAVCPVGWIVRALHREDGLNQPRSAGCSATTKSGSAAGSRSRRRHRTNCRRICGSGWSTRRRAASSPGCRAATSGR